MKVPKGSMIVLKGEIFGGLYRLVGNVQMDGAAGRASISNSSERQAARKKQVVFASSAEGGINHGGSS